MLLLPVQAPYIKQYIQYIFLQLCTAAPLIWLTLLIDLLASTDDSLPTCLSELSRSPHQAKTATRVHLECRAVPGRGAVTTKPRTKAVRSLVACNLSVIRRHAGEICAWAGARGTMPDR